LHCPFKEDVILIALFQSFDRFPRRWAALVCAVCVSLLLYGLYLQHGLGLEPCPMCIVQRYALMLIALVAAINSLHAHRVGQRVGHGLMLVLALGGAFVAARQSWLQWYPPEVASCGRDLYGMIESFPLQRVIPMVFRGSGDCSTVDWTFLGGSIANWSFLCFCGLVLYAVLMLWRSVRAASR
jgi:disulfide bond formation protein DsbB